MAKAKPSSSTPDLGPAIARLREIAANSADRLLLADGPPHPDAALLDLCAEIAYRRKIAEQARQNWHEGFIPKYKRGAVEEAQQKALDQARDDADHAFSHLLRKAAKMPATTAAGIYAKALAVRSSKTGAATLAMSLANDLIACPGLRMSLWPADSVTTSAGGA